jgi:hypothetical protein
MLKMFMMLTKDQAYKLRQWYILKYIKILDHSTQRTLQFFLFNYTIIKTFIIKKVIISTILKKKASISSKNKYQIDWNYISNIIIFI